MFGPLLIALILAAHQHNYRLALAAPFPPTLVVFAVIAELAAIPLILLVRLSAGAGHPESAARGDRRSERRSVANAQVETVTEGGVGHLDAPGPAGCRQ